MGLQSRGTRVPATRQMVERAKKSNARKNNTFDNVIMFGRMEMIEGEEVRRDVENM